MVREVDEGCGRGRPLSVSLYSLYTFDGGGAMAARPWAWTVSTKASTKAVQSCVDGEVQ